MHTSLRLSSILKSFSSWFTVSTVTQGGAFSSSFSSAFGGSTVTHNTAHGGLTLRLSVTASARTRKPRDIAGTLHNELSSSQVTASQLISMLTGSPRRVAGNFSNQLASAQTTLSQLISILPK